MEDCGDRAGRTRRRGAAELHRGQPELDAIVDFFEQREVDVDVLVARLERATALIDELDRRLRQTRAQVEELVPRLDALAVETAGGGDGRWEGR